ncbi:MAG: MTH1187 family thiamine-binding protein [Acidobacteriota bacterium]
MLARFSVSPVGSGEHLGDKVADAIQIVRDSGLDHQVTAMDTLIEGEWDEVMEVIRACVDALHSHSDRVICEVKIDDWKGRSGLLEGKVESVERRLS